MPWAQEAPGSNLGAPIKISRVISSPCRKLHSPKLYLLETNTQADTSRNRSISEVCMAPGSAVAKRQECFCKNPIKTRDCENYENSSMRKSSGDPMHRRETNEIAFDGDDTPE